MARVKLSYTVEEEDILKEAAKILNLCGEDMQQAISLFKGVQDELTGAEDDGGTPNTPKAREMIKEFRVALLQVDTRLEEVNAIVEGYEDYQKGPRGLGLPPAPLGDVDDAPGADL
jgi:hypothetical protein